MDSVETMHMDYGNEHAPTAAENIEINYWINLILTCCVDFEAYFDLSTRPCPKIIEIDKR